MDCLFGLWLGHYHASPFFQSDQNKIWNKANVYTDEDHWSNDAYKCSRLKHISFEIDLKYNEWIIWQIKDRKEYVNDIFPCTIKNSDIQDIANCIRCLFFYICIGVLTGSVHKLLYW